MIAVLHSPPACICSETFRNVVSGDTVTLGTSAAAGAFVSKDVGQNITVSVTGLTLGGAQAGDYTLTQPTTAANITAATLTVTGITAADKTYNGNTTATLQGLATASLVGVVSGDTVTLGTSAAAGTFVSKDVGQNITVSVTGLTLGGSQAGDYTLTQPTTAANITAATLTVTGITAADKTYNGNTTATLQGLATASLVGVVSGDTVTLGTSAAAGTFVSKDVGQNITVSVTGLSLGGSQAGDYTLTQPTTAANIIARAITVAAVTYDKVYDGTTSAAAVPVITSGSLLAGDTAAFSESFDNQNEGIDKTLTAAGSVSDGDGGNDYAVTFVTNTLGAIGQRAITVTAAANSKAYDGTVSAAAVPSITSGSLAASDSATWTETYDTPAAGTGKTLTPFGSVNDDNGGANYSVTFVTDTTGVITQAVDHFLVTASATSITAGGSFILVVTAEDSSGKVVTNYWGTVDFSSLDPQEPVPAQAITCSNGVGYALASLETANSTGWIITAQDENDPSLAGEVVRSRSRRPPPRRSLSSSPSSRSSTSSRARRSPAPMASRWRSRRRTSMETSSPPTAGA